MNIDDYERAGRSKYEAFAKAVRKIIDAAIRADSGYRLQQVQVRAKDPGSLKTKLTGMDAAGSDTIEDKVKDLAGCRVIFYTNADVKRFLSSDILRDNFSIDWDRTKVHHPVPGTASEKRLFRSDNIVVQLNDKRAEAPEYAQFSGMRCEVQVQTTLNHAWSEMEHDVYKIKPADGFGADLLQGIQKRFDKVMRDMLIPAGYEFQQIVDDYHRLANGQELFDKGAMKLLAESPDNNERYELLERFKTYVLPHLDNPTGAHAEICSAMVAAVLAARTTAVKPISTAWGEFGGKTAADVTKLVTEILEHVRYVSLDAVQATFDALCELYLGAGSDEERKPILKAVKTLSTNNYEVWKSGGPIVQDIIVRRIRAWDSSTLQALRPIAVDALTEALRPEVSGTSATYKALTLITADVVASDVLARVRETCIDVLEGLFHSATIDVDRRIAKAALLDATRLPMRGSAAPAVKLIILQNSVRVARFFGSVADTLSFELLQSLEHSMLWLYRHTKLPNDAPAEPGDVAAARQAFIDAILAFRDRLDGNDGFVVYKTLVGFQSVFPHEWDRRGLDIDGNEALRNERISKLVADVAETNSVAWLTVLQRCASTKSDDLATFPPFMRFLEELARTKPEIVMLYLDRLGDELAIFLPSLLVGLEGTGHWPAAQGKLEAWVSERHYLGLIIFFQRRAQVVDTALLRRALGFAIAAGDDRAVHHATSVCALRADAIPRPELSELFVLAIGHLKTKGDTSWVHAIWAYVKDPLIESLSVSQIDFVLSALVPHPTIDTSAEWVLAAIAKRHPEKIIDFFGARLEHHKEEEVVDRYECVPYSITKLGPRLSTTAAYLMRQAQEWHRRERSMFEFRGGRVISIVFPEFTGELEGLLKGLLTSDSEAAQFVADVLRGYHGAPGTHELYKMIVDAVPEGHPALGAVEMIFIATGTTSGEFGRREAYQRKKEELQPWLTDSRLKVKALAQSHDLMLDRMIADEQRRGEDDIEGRKRLYGDDTGAADEGK